MKTQQWQLRKAPEPRTLADVESSLEKPVLCWNVEGDRILNAFVHCQSVCIVHADGFTEVYLHVQQAVKMPLVTIPGHDRPTRLDDVPDRRVILSGVNYSLMMFRESDKWFARFADRSDEWSRQSGPPSNWRLSDHCVELVETEVGVIE
ncbi:hypothetical protein UFOVP785_71 [uncultured Caudovirales phage]|uniref:Uncharacterized protein n=1 Tax=uncultured Caudovirales phage TaxID=2100421 RepID=A0A6J5NS57_9CAUD|nr:hypothetical protein UFOVP785_71 [uncultured Caudovirales phage]